MHLWSLFTLALVVIKWPVPKLGDIDVCVTGDSATATNIPFSRNTWFGNVSNPL